jgi:cytochrome c553
MTSNSCVWNLAIEPRVWALCLLLACLALASGATAEADESPEVRSLAATCAACHGTNGQSDPRSSVPSLTHLSAAAFIARMRAFRSDEHLSPTVMAQIAKGYDDQQVQELAAYFASKP